MESDYQVGEYPDGMAAIGCGEAYAMGALHAMSTMGELHAEQKVRNALLAAEHLSAGVRGPFTVLSIWGDDGRRTRS